MPDTTQPGLTDRQVQDFITDGYVKLDCAFSPDFAHQCRDRLWAEMGLSPDAPQGWTQPVIRLGTHTAPPFVAAANTATLHRAYDQLAGEDRWIAPQGLGTFPVRFPSATPPMDDGWHVDMSLNHDHPDFMEWRVNVKTSGRALLMLFLLSEVGPDDAPTRLRRGSHATIAQELLPYGAAGASLRQLATDGFATTADRPTDLATGSAGTVWLCHPFVVHAAQAHRGQTPRFVAQPPLLPKGEFDPTLPPSPVQIAIRQACGLSF